MRMGVRRGIANAERVYAVGLFTPLPTTSGKVGKDP